MHSGRQLGSQGIAEDALRLMKSDYDPTTVADDKTTKLFWYSKLPSFHAILHEASLTHYKFNYHPNAPVNSLRHKKLLG